MKMDRVVIDQDNIGDRVLLMPFWPGQAGRIMAGRPGTLFIVEGPTLHKFVAGKKGLEKFVEGAGNYRVTYDGSRLALRRQGVWSIVSTDTPPKPDQGRVQLKPIEFTINPREEWKQMFGEAWRRMREAGTLRCFLTEYRHARGLEHFVQGDVFAFVDQPHGRFRRRRGCSEGRHRRNHGPAGC
jgi:hypothetical protein